MHKERPVPLMPDLRALLDMRRHAPDGSLHPPEAFVFGTPFGEYVAPDSYALRKVWRETCEKAGITGLQLRDFRREFGSRLRETPNVTDHEVRDWLGHSNISQTSQYLASTQKSLHLARDRFEEHRKIRTNSHKSPDSAQAVVRHDDTESDANSRVN